MSMDKRKASFKYVSNKCASINEVKIKEDIFVGPQIRNLILVKIFDFLLW